VTYLSLGVGVFSCGRLRPHLLPITRIGGIASLLACGVISAALAANKVTVKLEGEIEPECAIQGGTDSTLDLGDISQPGSKEYGFVLNCNAPFTYRLEAQYGALTNTSASAVRYGFTGAVPYDVTVHIPTSGKAIEDRCASATIQAGRVSCTFGNSSNNVASNSQSQIVIHWFTLKETVTFGKYHENIKIIVTSAI
jgi:hypothetical protein